MAQTDIQNENSENSPTTELTQRNNTVLEIAQRFAAVTRNFTGGGTNKVVPPGPGALPQEISVPEVYRGFGQPDLAAPEVDPSKGGLNLPPATIGPRPRNLPKSPLIRANAPMIADFHSAVLATDTNVYTYRADFIPDIWWIYSILGVGTINIYAGESLGGIYFRLSVGTLKWPLQLDKLTVATTGASGTYDAYAIKFADGMDVRHLRDLDITQRG